MSTDDAGSFSIGPTRDPAPRVEVGKSASFDIMIQGDAVLFMRLHVARGSDADEWLVDRVEMDEVSVEISDDGAVHPPSVARRVRARVTNIGSEPAHFSGAWEVAESGKPADPPPDAIAESRIAEAISELSSDAVPRDGWENEVERAVESSTGVESDGDSTGERERIDEVEMSIEALLSADES